jgi:outer membrane lipoprotein carrier protein
MRIFKIMRFFIFLSILIGANTFAAQPAADDLAAKLANIKTMQASFTQTLHDDRGTVSQKTTGQMYLQRPGKFRWQITKPKQLLVADGNNLWVYDVDLQQVTKQRLNNHKVLSPAELLSGNVADLQRQFVVLQLTPNDFLLRPKSSNDMFQRVQLQFVNNQLRSLRFVNNLGQTSQLQFSQIQTNTPLNPALFRFSVPKGVDVVAQ